MKLSIIVLIIVMCSIEQLFAQDQSPLSLSGSFGGRGDGKRIVSQLQSTINTLVAANKAKPEPNSNIQYFWDMLSPLAQFILLNQTDISALKFNITDKVNQNISNLNWMSLPANVQTYLLNHESAQLLYMSFSKWGWCDSKNIYAPSTLFSLMNKKDQLLAPNVIAMIAPVHFNFKIDLNFLNKTLTNDIYYNYYGSNRFFQNSYLVGKYFDSFFRFFVNWFDQALLPEYMIMRSKRQSANSIFSQAIYRAESFLAKRFLSKK